MIMIDTKEKRGGARANAGRHRVTEIAKSRTICLIDSDWRKFKEAGGTAWLRALLRKL